MCFKRWKIVGVIFCSTLTMSDFGACVIKTMNDHYVFLPIKMLNPTQPNLTDWSSYINMYTYVYMVSIDYLYSNTTWSMLYGDGKHMLFGRPPPHQRLGGNFFLLPSCVPCNKGNFCLLPLVFDVFNTILVYSALFQSDPPPQAIFLGKKQKAFPTKGDSGSSINISEMTCFTDSFLLRRKP